MLGLEVGKNPRTNCNDHLGLNQRHHPRQKKSSAGTFRIGQVLGIFRRTQKQFGHSRTRLKGSRSVINLPDGFEMVLVMRLTAGHRNVSFTLDSIGSQIFESLFGSHQVIVQILV